MLKWFSGEEAESGSVVSTDVSVFLWTLIVIRVRWQMTGEGGVSLKSSKGGLCEH